MVTEGLSRDTVIMAKTPEDVTKIIITAAACKVGSVLILKMYFMPAPDREGAEIPRTVKNVLGRALAQEEGTWDNVDGGSNDISISKVCRCG